MRGCRRVIGPALLIEPSLSLGNHRRANDLPIAAFERVAPSSGDKGLGVGARFQGAGKFLGRRLLGVGSVALRIRLPKFVESFIDNGAGRRATAHIFLICICYLL